MSNSSKTLLSIAAILSGLIASPALAQEDATEEPSTSRFRWGVSAAGGPMMGGYEGGAGGLDARFGWQFDSMFAVYAQPALLLGAGASASVEGASATGLALYGMGVLADVTLIDLFYVGAGPELLLGAIGEASASASTTGTSASASGATGPFFSIAARAGFAFGSKRPD